MVYLQYVSTQLGIPLWLLLLVVVWNIAWKIPALWISARKKQIIWFVVLIFVNTMGILEILYIFIVSKIHKRDQRINIKTKSSRRKKRI